MECPCCFNALVDPLTLDCGHSFCRKCLVFVTKLAPDGRACPMCRATFTLDPAKAECDHSLVVKRDGYEERLAENNEAITDLLRKSDQLLPIFYMSPGAEVGGRFVLHLFEPRYKILSRRVIFGNRMFVYAPDFPVNGGEAVVVKVEDFQFHADGRAIVAGVGLRKVTLQDVYEEKDTGGLFICRGV